MSSVGDGDRHRENLGVSQTKQAKKKKSRRSIDPEDIVGSISSMPEHINHDTHLFVVPFGTANPRQYYPNYHRPVGAFSTSQALPVRRYKDLPLQAIYRARPLSAGTLSPTDTSPQLSAMRIEDSSNEQLDVMTGTPPFTQHFVHPDVSPSSTARSSATPDDKMPALAPSQKDRFGKVMIEPDGSSASARLSSWLKKVWDSGERPDWMLPHVFDELGLYWNTNKLKVISEQTKKARGSLKGGSLHTGGAKTVGTIIREMEKELGRTPIEPEVFKKTHVKKKENESDPDVWWRKWPNELLRLQSGLEGIGSSRQAETLDGVQIVVMSTQITQLTATLTESEQRRVAQQRSMSETVQQIKEQVMNLARRPTTSAPEDTDDDSVDEDDYVDATP
ncbi:hypothetical protein MTR67_013989 [Solanum verrucosum]|uniref:Uncharacterized protein n=1 Tax=Solanum verrucosum TaxID=315347 RepID=A0AAF0TIX0_SOLVR|nr:hypothetical protein MTR67_013989 [Solanum verrucosum]